MELKEQFEKARLTNIEKIGESISKSKLGKSRSEETKKKIAVANTSIIPSIRTLHIKDLLYRKSQGIVIRQGSIKGWKHTVDSLEKIKVRSNQEDNKVRIRNIQKIAAKNRVGKHLSTDIKIKSMTSKFGKLRQIQIYKDDELYNICNFSSDASILTGVKRSAISNNLVGISKSAGGYIFKYKNVM